MTHRIEIELPDVIAVPQGATALPLTDTEINALQQAVDVARRSGEIDKDVRNHLDWIASRLCLLFQWRVEQKFKQLKEIQRRND